MDKDGMTEEEARRFHRYFSLGMFSFIAVAAAAHMLAWSWRPWF
jgi:light-harvesting complex 1 beta chain